ncbi:MAG: CBS domain-containing protein [Planctomycetes bacterium]|nr:CBS domain-containing protein [Planctomycetota bacterium]
MSKKVITVSPSATAEDTIRMLYLNRISGAPVVDADGELLGLITEFQLLGVVFDPELKEVRVGTFMTRDVLTVDESDLLSNVASLMVSHRIRRLPVVRNNKVVGIVARRDVINYMVENGESIHQLFDDIRNSVYVANDSPA